MDWLEFIQKSEWPVVAAGALWIYRAPITEILGRLRPKKFKGFGADLEFDPEPALQKAEELTKEIPAPVSELPKLPADPSPDHPAPPVKPSSGMAFDEAPPQELPSTGGDQMAASPSTSVQHDDDDGLFSEAFVIRAFRLLNESILRTFRVRTQRWDARIPVVNAARVIGFSEDEIAALRELQTLRNKVAHEHDVVVTPTEAERFVRVARLLQARSIEQRTKFAAEGGRQTPQVPTDGL